MAHGDKDSRVGSGYMLAGAVREPTLAKAGDCMCSWSVIKTGPGLEAISELKYANSLCPQLRAHQAAAAPASVLSPLAERWAAGADG